MTSSQGCGWATWSGSWSGCGSWSGSLSDSLNGSSFGSGSDSCCDCWKKKTENLFYYPSWCTSCLVKWVNYNIKSKKYGFQKPTSIPICDIDFAFPSLTLFLPPLFNQPRLTGHTPAWRFIWTSAGCLDKVYGTKLTKVLPTDLLIRYLHWRAAEQAHPVKWPVRVFPSACSSDVDLSTIWLQLDTQHTYQSAIDFCFFNCWRVIRMYAAPQPSFRLPQVLKFLCQYIIRELPLLETPTC